MEAYDSQNIKQEKSISHCGEELILAVVAYYKDLDGKELTPEEAELYLDSLARLGHCMKESIRQGFGGSGLPPQAAPAPEPSDLSLLSEQIRTQEHE